MILTRRDKFQLGIGGTAALSIVIELVAFTTMNFILMAVASILSVIAAITTLAGRKQLRESSG